MNEIGQGVDHPFSLSSRADDGGGGGEREGDADRAARGGTDRQDAASGSIHSRLPVVSLILPDFPGESLVEVYDAVALCAPPPPNRIGGDVDWKVKMIIGKEAVYFDPPP
jgi:hypothetical protein